MKPKTDLKEMAGWVATLPSFTIGQFIRKYDLKYNDAASYVEIFEKAGILGPFVGNKPRQVLIDNVKHAKMAYDKYMEDIKDIQVNF